MGARGWGDQRRDWHQNKSSGNGCINTIAGALILIVSFFVLVGALVPEDGVAVDVPIEARADGHVEEGHGTKARDVTARNNDGDGKREYWWSQRRNAMLVSKCAGTQCTCLFVDTRGMMFDSNTFDPTYIAGRGEITSYFCSTSRKAAIIIRDGYNLLGTW